MKASEVRTVFWNKLEFLAFLLFSTFLGDVEMFLLGGKPFCGFFCE